MTLVAICLVIPQRMRLSGTVTNIWRLKDNGSQPWPFGVTWRHRLHDHLTPEGRLPMGGP